MALCKVTQEFIELKSKIPGFWENSRFWVSSGMIIPLYLTPQISFFEELFQWIRYFRLKQRTPGLKNQQMPSP